MKIFLILMAFFAMPVIADNPPLIIGWVENIAVVGIQDPPEKKQFLLKAKIDTGATTSSIDAEIIDLPEEKEQPANEEVINDERSEEEEEEESKPSPPKPAERLEEPPLRETVIFSLTNEQGKKKVLERKLERWVQIKKKTGGTIRRPVIKMAFCIAGRLVEEEVNLSQRDHFTYSVLIGRNMLEKGNYLVDSSVKFSGKARCALPQNG